ncbi:LysR family transcriptional regulator, partial [Streptomyces platensis subsp. clarensis]|nr:LysR family transcriptional regulator [Streptomyces platensis subsp. clarensis]
LDEAAAGGLRTLEITAPRPRGRVALAGRTEGPAGPAARALLGRLRAALPVVGTGDGAAAAGGARQAAGAAPDHQAVGA